MCGITGLVGNFDTVDDDKINELRSILSHRGPDNFGYKQITQEVFFAHHRLSILDPTDFGNQPFEDDQFLLIYNGEIYNHWEIRRQLPLSSNDFKSSSDTDTLFHSLKNWGIEKTLACLKGMFAFAWYDKLNKKLFLARDKLGIKPLIYIRKQGVLNFSSEIKGLKLFNHLEPNDLSLLDSLTEFSEAFQKNGLFKDVDSVKPGEFISFDLNSNHLKHEKYFKLHSLIDSNYFNYLNQLKQKEIVQEFANIFNNSV